MEERRQHGIFIPFTTAPWFALFGSALMLVTFLLCYENVWFNVESYGWTAQIRKVGDKLSWDHFKLAFSTRVFEANYMRASRPFSHIFQIFDTFFRMHLWKSMIPHPSLSLTYFFAFLFSPFLLFGFLRNLGIKRSAAILGVSLFLISPGNLSTTAMYFRPAKALANFSLILCLFLAGRIELARASSSDGKTFLKFLGLCLLVFVLFFVDETGVLLFPAVAVFFPALILRGGRWLIYGVLPIAYYFTYKNLPKLFIYINPDSAQSHWYPDTPFGQNYSWDYIQKLLIGFVQNVRNMMAESFGLASLTRLPSFWPIVLCTLAYVSTFYILYHCGKDRKNFDSRLFIWKQVGFLLFLIAFHSYLMAIGNHWTWGIYYYGSYLSLFVAILFASLLDKLNVHVAYSSLATVFICGASLYMFHFTNRAFKNASLYWGYGESPVMANISSGRVNRYTLSKYSRSLPLYLTTRQVWMDYARCERADMFADWSKELGYVRDELTPKKCGK